MSGVVLSMRLLVFAVGNELSGLCLLSVALSVLSCRVATSMATRATSPRAMCCRAAVPRPLGPMALRHMDTNKQIALNHLKVSLLCCSLSTVSQSAGLHLYTVVMVTCILHCCPRLHIKALLS